MSRLMTQDEFEDLYEYLADRVTLSNCKHTLYHTRQWLEAHQLPVRANIEKIIDLGGHCDCEVLLNVQCPQGVIEWNTDEELIGPQGIGEEEFGEFVSEVMMQSLWEAQV